MDDSEGIEQTAPVWAVFGDLMSGLLGAFVLILVAVLGVQLELASSLEAEINKRQIEEQRRMTLEKALAIPLAAGRITLNNGRFADNWELSAQRALTVTRALIDEGMPSAMVFAAAFGAEQPVTPNSDEAARQQNRRVEMAPVPKATPAAHVKP